MNNQDSKSRATELYQQIQKGKINTDDEAAKFLFGPEANSEVVALEELWGLVLTNYEKLK